ncbi:MAG: GIY-YIG nuclease family protein [Moraxellaceae bacterium]|nr:GIY-YIG nuclease family protein [Moraxellaceae bacterium]
MSTARPWFLYVLECRDGSLYTGITVDVEKRFAVHLAGKGARYTRSHPPKRIRAVVSHPDRAAASRAEYAVKQLSAAEKQRFCALHAWPQKAADA